MDSSTNLLEVSKRYGSPPLVRCPDIEITSRYLDRNVVPWQRSSIMVSAMTFVFPYGLSACNLVDSGMGITGGVPYTVADEE